MIELQNKDIIARVTMTVQYTTYSREYMKDQTIWTTERDMKKWLIIAVHTLCEIQAWKQLISQLVKFCVKLQWSIIS